jgi:sugar/nucleoside kinase (ribokinase family)
MSFHDWPEKLSMLSKIRFLKTDAAEAEILTGSKDRAKAAKMLYDWGAKEIMITHNTEVIIYDGKKIYAEPLKPRNLSGRTGRGDTCFSAYITERLTKDIPEALLTAAALVSLKMEKPGPFNETRAELEAYIKEFYRP